MDILKYKNKLCFALDVDTINEALNLVDILKEYVGIFKIGLQLFTSEGPEIVKKVNNKGGKVFLDLKFHDIPNTVANAGIVAAQMGVYIIDVHVTGGSDMMKALAESVKEEADKRGLESPKILGITVLTSIDEKLLRDQLKVEQNVTGYVSHLAQLAKLSGLDGVVCSAHEISIIRESCGQNFIILTPGIRPKWSINKDDQKRVVTPVEAVKLGSDIIVVGRPLRFADDPKKAAEKILKEIAEGF